MSKYSNQNSEEKILYNLKLKNEIRLDFKLVYFHGHIFQTTQN